MIISGREKYSDKVQTGKDQMIYAPITRSALKLDIGKDEIVQSNEWAEALEKVPTPCRIMIVVKLTFTNAFN